MGCGASASSDSGNHGGTSESSHGDASRSAAVMKAAPRATRGRWTELHEEAEKGNAANVRREMGITNANAGDENGWTPLLEAAEKGHINVVNALLGGGANPNIADKNGWTPLMAVAEKGTSAIATCLLGAKADIEFQDYKGWTCTMEAAEKGNASMVALFANHANPEALNVTDTQGWTAFMAACEGGNVDCVKTLWIHGAEHNLVYNKNWTALDEAKLCKHQTVIDFMQPIMDAESELKLMVETDDWKPEEAIGYLEKAQQVWCLKTLVTQATNRLTNVLEKRVLKKNSPDREECFDWLLSMSMGNMGESEGNDNALLQDAMVDVCRGRLAKALEGDSVATVKWAMASTVKSKAYVQLPDEMKAAAAKYKALMDLPDAWDVNQMAKSLDGFGRMVHKNPIEDEDVVKQLQEFAIRTIRKKYTRDRRGEAVPDGIKVVKVVSVHNDEVFQEYVLKSRKLPAPGLQPENLPPFLTQGGCACLPELDSAINETWLWHGTNEAAAEAITSEDFRLNLAGSNAGTLYGSGIYFADSVSKSDEYCTASNEGIRCLLLCRVSLGRILYTDEVSPNTTEITNKCLTGEYNSVLGDREKCRGTFKEFIVFDDDQAYPEYIIYYKRSYSDTSE